MKPRPNNCSRYGYIRAITWLLYGLAALLGVTITYTNYHPDSEGELKPVGRSTKVANCGPNLVHLAMCHDVHGRPYHFDLVAADPRRIVQPLEADGTSP